MQKVEMIISYTTDGTDYQYNDNHGILTRCKDCKWWHTNYMAIEGKHGCEILCDYTRADDYCSKAKRREQS